MKIEPKKNKNSRFYLLITYTVLQNIIPAQCCFIFDTTTLDKYPNKSLPYLGFGNRQNKLQLKWSHRTILIKPRSSVQMLRSNKKKWKAKANIRTGKFPPNMWEMIFWPFPVCMWFNVKRCLIYYFLWCSYYDCWLL